MTELYRKFNEKVNSCDNIDFRALQKCDPKDGLKIRCTECNINMAYGRWSHHVDEKHNANKSQDQVDDGNVEAENRPAPKKRAEPNLLNSFCQ